MKNSLLRLLAVSAFAVSLTATACTKSVKTVEIFEAIELKTDGTWELEGQRIKIEHLALTARWGNHFIGGYAPSASTGDKPHIEAELKNIPTFTEKGDGYGADITLEGVLTDVNGRPVLKDATCKVNSERINKKASDGHGLPIWYFKSFTRSSFDYNLDRTTCGTIIGDGNVFQLASVPSIPDGSWVEDEVFYVTFPGENLSLEDEWNLSPIPVVIPAGLNDATTAKLKSILASKEVGDFIDLDSYVTSYDTDLWGVYIQIEDFWGVSIKNPAKNPEVYSTSSELKAVYDPKFEQPIIDAIFNDEKCFSYVPTEYTTVKAAKEAFNDPSFVKISGTGTDSHMLRFLANVPLKDESASDLAAYLDAIAEYLDAEEHGWKKPENGVYTYEDTEGVVTREVVLSLSETNPTYLDIMYFGKDAPAAPSPVIK